MATLRKSAVAALIVLTATMGMAFGQLRKQVYFDINVDYSLRMADYLLPAGHYVIYQVDDNNPNLFYLYKDNLTHSPIATINTVRKDYTDPYYPEHTKVEVRVQETRGQGMQPVLRGWDIPGEDGWRIISVVPRRGSMLTRIQ